MVDISGVGAFGIVPYLSEDILKQAKLAGIHTQAGKVAYILTFGEKAKKPQIKQGVYEARGALKWIEGILKEKPCLPAGREK